MEVFGNSFVIRNKDKFFRRALITIGQFGQDSKPIGNRLEVNNGGVTFGTSKYKGYGIRKQDNGVYTGQFYYSSMDGKGELTYCNGTKYVGDFRSGDRSGRGTITFPDGFSFTSDWMYNIPINPRVHPKVQECIEKKICTKSLGNNIPQRVYDQYCIVCKDHQDTSPRPIWSEGHFGCNCSKC
eukprot:TRINITY_DN3377_c0_g1_i1.p1 TRINITY_DN3377_c0_g1~~TRINITY_DN3377_c0_g1_i1.p1  ORF type:complete len:183 (-),score=19.09 TRINITY_DN3377_c0_g1_i1:11-559(-)